MPVASLQIQAIRPIALRAGGQPAAAAAAPRLLRKKANMVGLLRSWQRMGGLTSRAVDTWGAAPAFSRSHRTIAYAVDAAATTDAPPPAAGKVKRPATAYSRYVADNFNAIAEANPDTKGVGQLGKLLGKQWSELPESEKNKYKEAAAAAKAAFDKEYPDGPPKPPPKPVKKAKAPRAPSAYNVFVKERLPIIKAKQGGPTKDAMAAAGKEWSALNDAEKAKYKPT